jgi:CPA2 family monovalent cation:H+ antiporter-2
LPVPHDVPLIATMAAGLAVAFVCGYAAIGLRLPPIIGYILGGIVVGPFTPGFVADAELATQLAEIGVMLMMFGVGMHFSLRDLMAVRAIAVPGAIVQISAATLMGAGMARLWGWPWGSGLIFGLALSVASTVVLLRALEERGKVTSPDGRIAVGWLLVEDLATVLALVLLPAVAGVLGGQPDAATMEPTSSDGLLVAIAMTIVKVGVFIALMLVVGGRFLPWLLDRVVDTGSRELFTLAIVAAALGLAFGSAVLFDVSYALGAFFAGMVVNASVHSERAAKELQPLQDAFTVLFFVAVGMLFDPAILVERPVLVLGTVMIVVFGKSLAAFVIVLAFGHPLHTALRISAALAQIGEFSFILAALGIELGYLSQEGQNLIVAGAIVSITLNPLAFSLADAMQKRHQSAAGAER